MNMGVTGPADPPPPWPITLTLLCRSWLCNASLCLFQLGPADYMIFELNEPPSGRNCGYVHRDEKSGEYHFLPILRETEDITVTWFKNGKSKLIQASYTQVVFIRFIGHF